MSLDIHVHVLIQEYNAKETQVAVEVHSDEVDGGKPRWYVNIYMVTSRGYPGLEREVQATEDSETIKTLLLNIREQAIFKKHLVPREVPLTIRSPRGLKPGE